MFASSSFNNSNPNCVKSLRLNLGNKKYLSLMENVRHETSTIKYLVFFLKKAFLYVFDMFTTYNLHVLHL